ncbi:MAG: NAD-dependent protein deacylase, partial [Planctomycetes bacterium]|nr:NAD-dependent protein deacylase [Planctomycetota bacterium]
MNRPLRALVVLGGAGLSADSGLPTFRGAGGLWEG